MTHLDPAWSFATRAIHAGQEPDPTTGAVVTPIYQTSTFVLEDMGASQAYSYSRKANPTRTALETCLASLEGAARAMAFASGLAAVSAAAHLLHAGDRALIIEDVYGGTRQLYDRILIDQGIRAEYVNATDLEAVRRALAVEPRLVWLESPTNPLIQVIDLAAVARLAHDAGALVAVDNTFASPYLQRPLELGADIVHYSTTKYLAGHSDLIGGALLVKDAALGERLAYLQYIMGAVPGPMDAWLALRGIKTLALRMEQHCNNAEAVARLLAEHPAVAEVRYPGLPSHPQHALAARQMRRFGGMVSFELRGGEAAARHVCRSVCLFALAPSLGGVESLLCQPATTTHAACTPEQRADIGIRDGLLRLSCGIEATEDLLRDLEQALDGAPRN